MSQTPIWTIMKQHEPGSRMEQLLYQHEPNSHMDSYVAA
jgi:hypothetical protein